MAMPPTEDDFSRSIPPSRQRGGPSRGSRAIRLVLLSVALVFVGWTIFQLYQSCGTTLEQGSDAPTAPAIGARGESASGYGELEPAFVASAAGHTLIVTDASGNRYIQRHAHRGAVRALALSTRAQYLATGDGEGALRIWTVAYLGLSTDKPVMVEELRGSLTSIDAMTFSQDERYLLVVGDQDSAVDLWDVEERKLLRTLSVEDFRPGNTEAYILRLHLATDGKVLGKTLAATVFEYVVGAGDAPEQLPVLVDNVSGDVVRYQSGPERGRFNPAKSLSWNPDGRYWGYAEGSEIQVWKLCPTGQCKQVEVDGRRYLE